jgi:hypothetical protein
MLILGAVAGFLGGSSIGIASGGQASNGSCLFAVLFGVIFALIGYAIISSAWWLLTYLPFV